MLSEVLYIYKPSSVSCPTLLLRRKSDFQELLQPKQSVDTQLTFMPVIGIGNSSEGPGGGSNV